MANEPVHWYKIGDMPGLRSLKEQLRGLEKLQRFISRSSVLDLGCAEGSISKWLVDSYGADHVDGIESVAARVDIAKALSHGYENLHYYQADLNAPMTIEGLLPIYDIVLALAILHKLKDPEGALQWAAAKAWKYLVVRMPGKEWTFMDRRSDGKVFDPKAILEPKWKVFSAEAGPRDELTIIFHRQGK